MEVLAEILNKNNIKASQQRIKILEYVSTHPCHPTVEHIFNVLHPKMPTLSKSTVYNTLKAFSDAGLVRVIAIEDNEIRYDYCTKDHGHFKCNTCGNVYDFDIDIDNVPYCGLDDFEVSEKNVFFKGICKRCFEK